MAETTAETVQKREPAQNHSEEVEEQDGRAASAHSDHPCKKPEAQNSPDKRHGDSKVEAQCLETEQDEHRDSKVELAKQVRAKKNAKKRGNSKVELAEQGKAQEDAKKHIPTCKAGTYLENEHGGFKVKANQRCAEDEHGDGSKVELAAQVTAQEGAKKHIPTCKAGAYLENDQGDFKVKANQRCAGRARGRWQGSRREGRQEAHPSLRSVQRRARAGSQGALVA